MTLPCHEWMQFTAMGPSVNGKTGLFGIEIETETNSAAAYPAGSIKASSDEEYKTPLKNWKAIKDGSLRDFGVEYVLKGPQTLGEVRASLDEFQKVFGGVQFKQNSPNTSVHVHINMTRLSMTQIVNFVMLYYYVENLLIEFSGPTRRSNLFALPLRVSDSALYVFTDALKRFEEGSFTDFPTNESNWKYSALNFCPFLKHGSFEVRSFRGSTNVEEIWIWVCLLEKLYRAAESLSGPEETMDFIRGSRASVVRSIFKDLSHHLEFPEIVEMVNRNMTYVVMLYSTIEDWSSFEDNMTKWYTTRLERAKKRGAKRSVAVTPSWVTSSHIDFNSDIFLFPDISGHMVTLWVNELITTVRDNGASYV